MKVTRAQVVDGAYEVLCEQGLGGFSMRRVALDLGVQPGALYYHVTDKQDLLAAVAARIVDGAAISTADPRTAAQDLRRGLSAVRDGAEVVSFAYAFRPDASTLMKDLPALFADRLDARRARWAAQTLVHYVLGYVAAEQNRAELVRTGIVPDDPTRETESAEAFLFGIDAILGGLGIGQRCTGPPMSP